MFVLEVTQKKPSLKAGFMNGKRCKDEVEVGKALKVINAHYSKVGLPVVTEIIVQDFTFGFVPKALPPFKVEIK